jgi:hypothetical protein
VLMQQQCSGAEFSCPTLLTGRVAVADAGLGSAALNLQAAKSCHSDVVRDVVLPLLMMQKSSISDHRGSSEAYVDPS